MPRDPHAKAMLDEIDAFGAPDLEGEMADARASMSAMVVMMGPGEEVESVEDRTIDAGGTAAAGAHLSPRRPRRRPAAVLVFFYGGRVDWLPAVVTERAKRWGARVALDRSGPLAWLATPLERAGDTAGRVGHLGDLRLQEAVAAAQRRRSGDRCGLRPILPHGPVPTGGSQPRRVAHRDPPRPRPPHLLMPLPARPWW